MGRENSPYVVGDYWLDKRRDGKSPNIWQIATYSPASRSDVYRSTKQGDLDAAKSIIHAYVEKARSMEAQPADEAKVIPQLVLYIEERAGTIINAAQSRSSMRAFIGFLAQDQAGSDVTVAQLDPALFDRFRVWRMGPHEYSVEGRDKVHEHTSSGVSGETVQRNLDDVGAALNYAVFRRRIPWAPKIANLDQRYRSRPRDVRLSIKQLGAMYGYAAGDIEAKRWLALMIGTAGRPDALLAFDPALQDRGDLLDLHPHAWPRTKKVNPVVPAIVPLRPILEGWKANPHKPAKSRKRWWRTMRRALALGDNIVPKTIRHTIATELRGRGVPGGEVSGLLGHDDPEMEKTSLVYAKYDPKYLAKAKRVLTKIFVEVEAEAEAWRADHLRTIPLRGKPIVIDKRGKEAQKS